MSQKISINKALDMHLHLRDDDMLKLVAPLSSKTFSGVAKAIAFQYSAFIKSGLYKKEWDNLPLSEINRIFA